MDYHPPGSIRSNNRWNAVCRRLPRRVRYWVVVDAYARALRDNPQTPMFNLNARDVLEAIDK